ncbi:MAG TPA: hypothetical protein VLM75_00565 [Spirochaetota bacterium]|nr:hypothetical protein [Spirochaetota bacterium]
MLNKKNTGYGPLISLAVWFLSLMSAVTASAYSDQTTTERILNENKSFIDFMDVCVTNFGEERKDLFKEVYRSHFNAEVAFLQSDYRGAFKRLYESQGKHVGLFAEMVRDWYLEGSKDILDSIAPEIIRSKNSRAKLYLTLGYRDRAVGFNHYTIGTASNPKLHSYKIYKYVESIKMARRAKRYAFLALYESRTGEMKRKIFNHLFEMEREAGSPFYNRFLAKNGDSFLNELNREYYDYAPEEATSEKPADGVPVTQPGREFGSFEKRTERRVRFRGEKTVAHHLLAEEFEKAEDTIREYVDDFNFKIIKATIEMLAAERGEPGGGVEYKKFLLHHTDNYARFSKESALSTFSGTVKVEDLVEKEKPAGEMKPGDKTAEHAGEEPAEAKK